MKPWNARQTRSMAVDGSSAGAAPASDDSPIAGDPNVTAAGGFGVADSVELMGPVSDSCEALDDDDCWGAGTLNDNFLDPKCSH
jgi:hypothetical protein